MRKVIAALLMGAVLAGGAAATPAVANDRDGRSRPRYEHQKERLKVRHDRGREQIMERRDESRERRDRGRRNDRDYGYYGRGYDRDRPN